MTISEAKDGMRVRVDGGFTCLKEGAIRTVKVTKRGDPWIQCAEGSHYLNGQICDEKGTLSGIEPVP